MAAAARDSSHASIRLLRNNYRGPRLLKTVGAKPELSSLTSTEKLGISSTAADWSVDVEVNAPPLSSSDEDGESAPSPRTVHPRLPVPHAKTIPQLQGQTKGVDEHGTARSKRQRPRIETNSNTISPSRDLTAAQDDATVELWSSQTNKRLKESSTYSRKVTQGDGRVQQSMSPAARQHPQSGFSLPLLLPQSPEQKPNMTRNASKQGVPRQTSVSARRNVGAMFSMPADIPTEPLSSATSMTDASTLFELPEFPDQARAERSLSTSSLSSVNSAVSLLLTSMEKDALHTDNNRAKDARPPLFATCPICHLTVTLTQLESFNSGRRLDIRAQQRFCLSHRMTDAQAFWKESSYPTIDWTRLARVQIPNHFPRLRAILKCKISSPYRESLARAAEVSNSSHKGVQQYLKEGLVQVVKYGYYGPRGAKIMGHAITEHMSALLNQEAKLDKVVRAAGVSGFVSAVLVPELTVRLVMEDMGVDERRAKEILEESEAVGVLLCEDDDEIGSEDPATFLEDGTWMAKPCAAEMYASDEDSLP